MKSPAPTVASPGARPQDGELPEAALHKALEMARPETRAETPSYLPARTHQKTRRGVVWVGLKCNLRCHFCYYIDRVSDADHQEYPFMSLDKARAICKTLVEVYGNNSVDIQGGEPTLWKDIYALLGYCREIGLDPTIITNAQVLSSREVVRRYREAGIRDFVVSVQGLGEVYDEIVQSPGAHARQMRALRRLQEVGVPFRFNCVMSKTVLAQLPHVARLASLTGAKAVNFISFNPFSYQGSEGLRTIDNVPAYTEVAPHLDEALDVLSEAGVEGNVKHFPICLVAERHRKSVYNISQLPYDLHDNDFASWDWTSRSPQRVRDREMTPPHAFGPAPPWGPPVGVLRRLGRIPHLGPALRRLKRALDLGWARGWARLGGDPAERAWREEGRRRSEEQMRSYYGFRQVAACSGCDARKICDGYHGDYEAMFGAGEARPIQVGAVIDDPRHFTQHHAKHIHPRDATWLGEETPSLTDSHRAGAPGSSR